MSQYTPEQIALMKETLEETINFYGKYINRRALLPSGGCAYQTDDGLNCAVGRLCTPQDLLKIHENGWNAGHGIESIYEILQSPKIKSLPLYFLKHLQGLHDQTSFWDSVTGHGLTKDGEEWVNRMKREFSLN